MVMGKWSLSFHKIPDFVGNKAKGRISKRVFQESKACQNHAGNFGVLCFLETPVLRFALLPYYRQFMNL